MTKFKIDLWNTKQLLENEVIAKMNKANKFMKDEIDKQMPEDTGKLTRNTEIEWVRKEWSKIIWTISNDTEYMAYVEFWVKSKTYNYYKNWWRRKWGSPFYSWVGARPFTFSYDSDENINEVQKIFNK